METRYERFCDQVCARIPRATAQERREIRQELMDHLTDREEALREYAVSREVWLVMPEGGTALIPPREMKVRFPAICGILLKNKYREGAA